MSELEPAREALGERVERAITLATRYLLDIQQPRGCWQGPVEASAAMEAEYVFVNRLLVRERADIDRRMVERLLALQQPEGGWPLAFGQPGHLSTSIEAYFALKLTGAGADEPALARAREFIRGHGGLVEAGVMTRLWLAFFGQFPWSGVPVLPVELVLLPAWSPFSIYSLAGWMRATLVPLALYLSQRPTVTVAPEEGVAELWVHPPRPEHLRFGRSAELVTWHNAFLVFDRALHVLGERFGHVRGRQ